MDLLNWKIPYIDNTHSSWPSLIRIVLFRSKEIHGAVCPIQIFTTKKYWIFFFFFFSDRPWKEKKGWNANRRLYFEFTRPESTLSILGTSGAKVIEWVSRQFLKRTISCTLSARWATSGYFPRGFYCINLPLCDSCWSIYSSGRVGCRADDFKTDYPFIR